MIRVVGETPLRNHWPGTPAGLDAIVKLTQAQPPRRLRVGRGAERQRGSPW